VWLAASGGQWFWPDEMRYGSTQTAAYWLVHGQWHAAALELLGHPDHILFRWAGLPPALFEQWTGPHPALAASYFGLFSVLAIALIWAVARRAGAGKEEALWAAYLAAAADSLFYYSRHFFPYDMALAGMLGALWVGLGPCSRRNSFLAGATAGIGFLIYNGYWLLGGCVTIVPVVLAGGGVRRMMGRGAWTALGLVSPILLVLAVAHVLGFSLLHQARLFAGTVVQGDFSGGYRVLSGYLWHAEGGLLIFWLAAFGFALFPTVRGGRLRRLACYGGVAALLVGGLVFFSDVVPKFVVYGRLVRGVVPFLCLGAAAGIDAFLGSRGPSRAGWTTALVILVAALAASNFSTPLRQVFPDGFQRLAENEIKRRAGSGFVWYRLINAKRLWGEPIEIAPPPYAELLRRSHPLQFRPYQYEGYSAAQRAELNRSDIGMRLVGVTGDFGDQARQWSGYPGPVRLRAVFPRNRTGLTEPLVTTGKPGNGDFLLVSYLDASHVRFGFDHWGGGIKMSAPLEIDYGRLHEIVLSFGGLLPPADDGRFQGASEFKGWPGELLLIVDGRPVFFQLAEHAPSRPENIFFGVDLINGSGIQPDFSGQALDFGSAPAGVVDSALSAISARARGPLRLRLQFPPGQFGRGDPLLVTGISGKADLLSIHYADSAHVRFALDHWGVSYIESDLVAADYSKIHEVEIRIPTLEWPGPWDGGKFKGEIVILLDGIVVWRASSEYYRATPETLAIGANRVGGSTCEPTFSGLILNIERTNPPRDRP
jgi:hypothetical protein